MHRVRDSRGELTASVDTQEVLGGVNRIAIEGIGSRWNKALSK